LAGDSCEGLVHAAVDHKFGAVPVVAGWGGDVLF